MRVGSEKSTLCASANGDLGTSADNNPLTLLVAPTSKVVGPRHQSERIEEQIGNILCFSFSGRYSRGGAFSASGTSSTACCRGETLNIARSQPVQEQARVQEIPEIQVTEQVQDLITPERIQEVRQKLFVARAWRNSLTVHLVVFFSMLHQRMSYVASASSDAPTPARAVLDEWIAHMPFEGETPVERMMLRREAQEVAAEQAAQELVADEVATKPTGSPPTKKAKEGKHKR